MKYLGLKTFFLFCVSFVTHAQTQIKNCDDNLPLRNAIVNNANSGEWIGNTDNQGNINIPKNVEKIEIYHPDWGTVTLNNEETICVDSEILDELVIEIGIDSKQKLLEIFDNSYKTYKKANRGKKYYQIDYSLNGEQEGMLEKFNGILAWGSFFSTSFNNYTFEWNKAIKDNKAYEKFSVAQYVSYVNETMFLDKKTYKSFRDFIEQNDIQKIGNQYFVYQKNSEHFVTFDIDTDQQLILKYTNTRIFSPLTPYDFEQGDGIIMGKVEVNFVSDNADYFVQDLSVQEKYLVNNRHYYSDSFIEQKKLSKAEKKNLQGKWIAGFVMDRGDSQRAFLESLD